MNIERLKAVRDAILNPPEGYGLDMEQFVAVKHSCGTAFCIGGWALHLAGNSPEAVLQMADPEGAAMELLGLDRGQTDALFYPLCNWKVTPAQAAATIDRLIETGQVDWFTTTTEGAAQDAGEA